MRRDEQTAGGREGQRRENARGSVSVCMDGMDGDWVVDPSLEILGTWKLYLSSC